MSKSLVAYFSATGTTARTARKLAEAIHADLYEIKPETPYTREDLDWTDKNSRTTHEKDNPADRPILADKAADIAAHDIIYLGFPIWWYKEPAIVKSFLEAYDFSGKTIVAFGTSGGSQLRGSIPDMKPSAPGAKWVEGGMLNGDPGKDALADWAAKLPTA